MELSSEGAATAVRTQELCRAVEALVFVADEPREVEAIITSFTEVTGYPCTETDVEEAVEALNERYAREGAALRIHAWAGGYRMTTTETTAPYIRALNAGPSTEKLSRSLMETLAIIAYRQPVTKPEVDAVRGVDSGYSVRRLLELELADVVGRSESLGRPLLYGTTPRFLDSFGISSLDALPTLREVEDILDDPAFSRERARLLALKGIDPTQTEDASPTSEPSDVAASDEEPVDSGEDEATHGTDNAG